eukprot:scaffold82273_cov51-Prasinocladus_malaysianus.AAC.1
MIKKGLGRPYPRAQRGARRPPRRTLCAGHAWPRCWPGRKRDRRCPGKSGPAGRGPMWAAAVIYLRC